MNKMVTKSVLCSVVVSMTQKIGVRLPRKGIYVVVWQFFEVNFGPFDISKTWTSERPRNQSKKLKQKNRNRDRNKKSTI